MTKAEKFQLWMDENPEKLKILRDYAIKNFDYTGEEFDRHMLELKDWLIKKAGTQQVESKKRFDLFIRRNLKSKALRRRGHGRTPIYRTKPSAFNGASGRRKLS